MTFIIQEKQLMSNSFRRAAAKKQHKEFMKQAKLRNDIWEKENFSRIQELRNCPQIHDLNHLDF
jgi:hypothetical protein